MNILPVSLAKIHEAFLGTLATVTAYQAMPFPKPEPVEPMPTFSITKDSICFTWKEHAVNRL